MEKENVKAMKGSKEHTRVTTIDGSLEEIINSVTSPSFCTASWNCVTMSVGKKIDPSIKTSLVHIHKNTLGGQNLFTIKVHNCRKAVCDHPICTKDCETRSQKGSNKKKHKTNKKTKRMGQEVTVGYLNSTITGKETQFNTRKEKCQVKNTKNIEEFNKEKHRERPHLDQTEEKKKPSCTLQIFSDGKARKLNFLLHPAMEVFLGKALDKIQGQNVKTSTNKKKLSNIEGKTRRIRATKIIKPENSKLNDENKKNVSNPLYDKNNVRFTDSMEEFEIKLTDETKDDWDHNKDLKMKIVDARNRPKNKIYITADTSVDPRRQSLPRQNITGENKIVVRDKTGTETEGPSRHNLRHSFRNRMSLNGTNTKQNPSYNDMPNESDREKTDYYLTEGTDIYQSKAGCDDKQQYNSEKSNSHQVIIRNGSNQSTKGEYSPYYSSKKSNRISLKKMDDRQQNVRRKQDEIMLEKHYQKNVYKNNGNYSEHMANTNTQEYQASREINKRTIRGKKDATHLFYTTDSRVSSPLVDGNTPVAHDGSNKRCTFNAVGQEECNKDNLQTYVEPVKKGHGTNYKKSVTIDSGSTEIWADEENEFHSRTTSREDEGTWHDAYDQPEEQKNDETVFEDAIDRHTHSEHRLDHENAEAKHSTVTTIPLKKLKNSVFVKQKQEDVDHSQKDKEIGKNGDVDHSQKDKQVGKNSDVEESRKKSFRKYSIIKAIIDDSPQKKKSFNLFSKRESSTPRKRFGDVRQPNRFSKDNTVTNGQKHLDDEIIVQEEIKVNKNKIVSCTCNWSEFISCQCDLDQKGRGKNHDIKTASISTDYEEADHEKTNALPHSQKPRKKHDYTPNYNQSTDIIPDSHHKIKSPQHPPTYENISDFSHHPPTNSRGNVTKHHLSSSNEIFISEDESMDNKIQEENENQKINGYQHSSNSHHKTKSPQHPPTCENISGVSHHTPKRRRSNVTKRHQSGNNNILVSEGESMDNNIHGGSEWKKNNGCQHSSKPRKIQDHIPNSTNHKKSSDIIPNCHHKIKSSQHPPGHENISVCPHHLQMHRSDIAQHHQRGSNDIFTSEDQLADNKMHDRCENETVIGPQHLSKPKKIYDCTRSKTDYNRSRDIIPHCHHKIRYSHHPLGHENISDCHHHSPTHRSDIAQHQQRGCNDIITNEDILADKKIQDVCENENTNSSQHSSKPRKIRDLTPNRTDYNKPSDIIPHCRHKVKSSQHPPEHENISEFPHHSPTHRGDIDQYHQRGRNDTVLDGDKLPTKHKEENKTTGKKLPKRSIDRLNVQSSTNHPIYDLSQKEKIHNESVEEYFCEKQQVVRKCKYKNTGKHSKNKKNNSNKNIRKVSADISCISKKDMIYQRHTPKSKHTVIHKTISIETLEDSEYIIVDFPKHNIINNDKSTESTTSNTCNLHPNEGTNESNESSIGISDERRFSENISEDLNQEHSRNIDLPCCCVCPQDTSWEQAQPECYNHSEHHYRINVNNARNGFNNNFNEEKMSGSRENQNFHNNERNKYLTNSDEACHCKIHDQIPHKTRIHSYPLNIHQCNQKISNYPNYESNVVNSICQNCEVQKKIEETTSDNNNINCIHCQKNSYFNNLHNTERKASRSSQSENEKNFFNQVTKYVRLGKQPHTRVTNIVHRHDDQNKYFKESRNSTNSSKHNCTSPNTKHQDSDEAIKNPEIYIVYPGPVSVKHIESNQDKLKTDTYSAQGYVVGYTMEPSTKSHISDSANYEFYTDKTFKVDGINMELFSERNDLDKDEFKILPSDSDCENKLNDDAYSYAESDSQSEIDKSKNWVTENRKNKSRFNVNPTKLKTNSSLSLFSNCQNINHIHNTFAKENESANKTQFINNHPTLNATIAINPIQLSANSYNYEDMSLKNVSQRQRDNTKHTSYLTNTIKNNYNKIKVMIKGNSSKQIGDSVVSSETKFGNIQYVDNLSQNGVSSSSMSDFKQNGENFNRSTNGKRESNEKLKPKKGPSSSSRSESILKRFQPLWCKAFSGKGGKVRLKSTETENTAIGKAVDDDFCRETAGRKMDSKTRYVELRTVSDASFCQECCKVADCTNQFAESVCIHDEEECACYQIKPGQPYQCDRCDERALTRLQGDWFQDPFLDPSTGFRPVLPK